MFLKFNALIAASTVALSTAAIAQQPKPATPAQPAQPVQPAQPDAGKSDTAPGQMGTTPGQTQTTPGEASQNTPAATGTTPSGQVTPAAQADFKKGATIYDSTGAVVGTVDSATSSAATISTGKVRAAIPLSSFGKGEKGLVLGMSKSEFEAAASTAAAKTKPKK